MRHAGSPLLLRFIFICSSTNIISSPMRARITHLFENGCTLTSLCSNNRVQIVEKKNVFPKNTSLPHRCSRIKCIGFTASVSALTNYRPFEFMTYKYLVLYTSALWQWSKCTRKLGNCNRTSNIRPTIIFFIFSILIVVIVCSLETRV